MHIAKATILSKEHAKEDNEEHGRTPVAELRDALLRKPILGYPDYDKPFHIFTDASTVAQAGALMQEEQPKSTSPEQSLMDTLMDELPLEEAFQLLYGSEPGDDDSHMKRLEGAEFPERPKADPALPHEMLRYIKGLFIHEGIHPVLYRVKSLFGQGARLESVHMEVPLPDRIDLHTITLDQFAVNVLTEKRHVDIFHLLIGDLVWVYSLTPSKKFLKEGVPYPETIEQGVPPS
ncbi:hypothetical protein OSTOST_25158 [Ostertagia ostertagi]